jgi:Transposase DDE domain group 1
VNLGFRSVSKHSTPFGSAMQAAFEHRLSALFQLSFNGKLRVDFQGARVTSDGGLLLVRELDERLGLGEIIERHLSDGRAKDAPRLVALGAQDMQAANTQLPLPTWCAVGIQPTGGL